MPTEYVPDADTLMRFVKWGHLRKDEDDNIIGVNAHSFRLKPGEDFLSASWVEFFKTDDPLLSARRSFAKQLTIRPKDRFALGTVSVIKSACSKHGVRVRVTREPEDGFEEHSGVRQFRDDKDELLDLLAAEAWAQLVTPAPP